MTKQFSITRVVTKNIVTDSFQGIRNLFGLRLRGYEGMINQATKAVTEEMNSKYQLIKWWRLSVNPISHGSVMVIIYGEYDE